MSHTEGRRARRLVWAALGVLLAQEAVYRVLGVGHVPLRLAFPGYGWPFLAFALGTAGLVHHAARLRRSERWAALLAAALLFTVGGGPWLPAKPALATLASACGLGSLAAAAVAAIAGPDRGAARDRLAAAALLPLLVLPTEFFLDLSGYLHPRTLDLQLQAFDATLGNAAFAAGRVFPRWPALGLVSALAYQALPLAVGGVAARQWFRGERRRGSVVEACLVAGLAGYVLYHAFPAAGPRAAFGASYPLEPPFPDAGSATTLWVPRSHRNAMPSLHVAWIVLAWWGSRGQPWLLRSAVAAWGLLTVWYSLGMGEHFVVDFVVALPFALAAEATVSPGARNRRAALVAGTAATAGWLAVLRYGGRWFAAAPLVNLFACVGTVVFTLTAERQLGTVSPAAD